MQEANKDGNTRALDKLKNIDCSYSSENWLGDFFQSSCKLILQEDGI